MTQMSTSTCNRNKVRYLLPFVCQHLGHDIGTEFEKPASNIDGLSLGRLLYRVAIMSRSSLSRILRWDSTVLGENNSLL